MPDCPDDTELAGFLNDSLTGERLGHVSGHVDSCAHCQARLDRLTDQTSGAVKRYKELSSQRIPDAHSGANGGAAPDTLLLGKPSGVPAPFGGLPRVPGFDVIAEIGRGGMGVVYKARHRRLNRLVALKLILAGTAADPSVVQRFLFEAEVLARISHPQVVQIFGVDTYQGPHGVPIPYLAMELLEGGSLSRKLRASAAAPPADRWPAPRAAAELLEGLARAVHAAHMQGVIHRDLKPGNILFSLGTGQPTTGSQKQTPAPSAPPSTHPSLSAPLPKVLDFGLAKFTQEAGADLTQSGQVMGTPQYMAPEQAAGGRQLTPAVDVYALGAILFECLSGRPPFTGEPMSVLLKVVNEQPPDVRSLCPAVPRDLAAVTMKCLEKDPARRYASAEALADDLRRFLDDRPTRARPVTTRERAWLWARRNPAVAGLIAALVAVLVTGFVTVAALWVRAERTAADERAARGRIETAEADAREQAQKARDALLEAERQKALLEFGRAVASCEEGRVTEGLALFARVVELAEHTGQADLARVARVNLAAWPRELPPPTRALPHTEQPLRCAFTPDGARLVTAGRGGEAHLWDTATGTKLVTYKPVLAPFPALGERRPSYFALAVSPDGKTVAAGGSDRKVTLWHIERPDPVLSFEAAPDGRNLWALAFASDTVLWTSDGANGLTRWDLTAAPSPVARTRARPNHTVLARLAWAALTTGGLMGGWRAPPLRDETEALQVVALSPDGTRAYTGDRGGVVRAWDTARGVELQARVFRGWIVDVVASADGTRVAATGPEGIVWVLDAQTFDVVQELPLAGAYGNGVAFAPKRPYVIATDGDGNVRCWHRDTGQPVGVPLRLGGAVARPRFRPDSDQFAVGAGSAVHLCELPDPPGDVLSVGGPGGRIRGLCFAPDGTRLAATDEVTFDLFDPRSGARLHSVPKLAHAALSMCFDADPARPGVFRGHREGFNRLPLPDGRAAVAAPMSQPLGRVFRIESVPGGLYVMGQYVVARYDPETLAPRAARQPAAALPSGVTLGAMAVRPDGNEVLVSFADRVVFLKGGTLEVLREWKAGDEVLDARYTPDGTRVLVGRRDSAAELLDATTGRPVGVPELAHARAVVAVAVSPNGALFLTGSRDGTARFWDAKTGLPMGGPMRHAGPVTHVAFAPGGDHIATGTGTGTVTIWDLPPAPAQGGLAELRAKWGP